MIDSRRASPLGVKWQTELPIASSVQRVSPGGDSVSRAESSRIAWLSRGRTSSRCGPNRIGRSYS
jgi:hypothetical protein